MSQKLFRKILKQAQKEVGFDVQDSKLLIEAFISTEGFFILTFTKLVNEFQADKPFVAKPKPKRKIYNPSSETAIYQFEGFDEFESFCTYLNNSKVDNLKNFAKKISLYEYNSKYFLVFYKVDVDFKYSNFIYTSLSEFASLASTSAFFESKLIEYGKTIFKANAIQKGIDFFSKA